MVSKVFWLMVVLGAALPLEAQFPFGERESERQQPKFRFLVETREKERATEEAETTLAVERALDAVSRAFGAENASLLRDSLSDDRKVGLSLAMHSPDKAHYAPDQVRFIFERLFKDVVTREFSYDSETIEHRARSASIYADWTYLAAGSEAPVTLRLRFLLEKNGDDFKVFEISDR